MAKSASVIEINGNRYNAVNGQLLGAVKKVAAQMKMPAGGAIDGLVRRPSSVINKTRSANYKAHGTRRPLQHSQTLMRAAVKRPTLSKSQDQESKLHKPHVAAASPDRVLRAKTIIKNSRIEHFGKLRAKSSSIVTRRPQAISPATRPSLAASSSAAASTSLSKPLPSMVTSASHQQLERLLDQALIQADAHKQALRSRTKGWRRFMFASKWLTLCASSLAVLLLGGFFAWQNIPQVSMRVAATRAHVSASVPAYTPLGYSYAAPVSANNGKVSISYKTPGNSDKSYTITQQASNWDSSSLAANGVPKDSQASQINGTTIYTYGSQDNAKWVNHGVLFTIQDKANLSSDQILQIANSL